MRMEIEILERKAFDIKIGETVLEGFAVVSAWECFQKLKSDKHGEIVIMEPDGTTFSEHFKMIFGGGTAEFKKATVVRASPGIVALFTAAEGVEK